MISKMTRYDFVLYGAQSEDFIEQLRGLGLVDITTTGWEPSEQDRGILTDIDAHVKAVDFLHTFVKGETFDASAKPYATGEEAFAAYMKAQADRTALTQETARLEKQCDELVPWGRFSADEVAALAAKGVVLRYFTAQSSTFDKSIDEWSAEHTVAEINRTASTVYFVVVAQPSTEIAFDAQEVKLPAMDHVALDAEIGRLGESLAQLDGIFSRCARSIEMIEEDTCSLKERLQGLKVDRTARREADGELMIMEGWAEAETSERVDKMLEEYPNVVYLKRDATLDDNAPVKLKNNRFTRLFELIGAMYALPKYGTMDLTPFFGPFYMLFFAICLADAGYGLVLLALGIGLLLKGGEKMRQAAWLSVVCSAATVAFGFYANSFFGMQISTVLPGVRFLDFGQDFFSISLAIGVVQILLGMILNIYLKTKLFGFTSTFGTLGWFLVLTAGCISVGLPMLNEAWVIPWFTASSPAFMAVAGVGLVLMLLLNNVRRNPLINLGAGLWDAYNNITGLLSDVLSYIRLFAIGLSGGVLAQVFNSLGLGLTGLSEGIDGMDWWVVALKIVGASCILLIGHGINLFMSAISSFVHPMRLTFVEFYKNAGFEMSQRSFEPLQKLKNK